MGAINKIETVEPVVCDDGFNRSADHQDGTVKPIPKENCFNRLSKLQKFILRAALINARTGQGQEVPIAHKVNKRVDLCMDDVLTEYFGFPIKDNWKGYAYVPDVRLGESGAQQRLAHKFDASVIGKQRYQSAYASTSRAITRLWKRGLLVGVRTFVRCTAINLTAKGRAVAEKLFSET